MRKSRTSPSSWRRFTCAKEHQASTPRCSSSATSSARARAPLRDTERLARFIGRKGADADQEAAEAAAAADARSGSEGDEAGAEEAPDAAKAPSAAAAEGEQPPPPASQRSRRRLAPRRSGSPERSGRKSGRKSDLEAEKEKEKEKEKGAARHSFDVRAAIAACSAAGLHSHALYLARRHGLHAAYLRIQLEELRDAAAALAHLRRLPFDAALAHALHCRRRRRASWSTSSRATSPAPRRPRPPPAPSAALGRLLAPPAPAAGRPSGSSSSRPVSSRALPPALATPPAPARRQRADPEPFLPLFGPEHGAELLSFLEAAAAAAAGPPPARVANALFECLLQEGSEGARARAARMAEEAPASGLDPHHGLLLCHAFAFRPGLVALLGRLGQRRELLRLHIEAADADAATGALSPLLLFRALAAGAAEGGEGGLTLGDVRGYLSKTLAWGREVAEAEGAAAEALRQRTARARADIDRLRSSAEIYQSSKCAACASPLDLPASHFGCGHAYHGRCLERAPSGGECPLCLPAWRQLEAVRGRLEAAPSSERHRELLAELGRAAPREDGFRVIPEFLAAARAGPLPAPSA
eukprot:tig00000310_g23991.t1